MAMNAEQIQNVTLGALKMVGAHVLQSTVTSLSDTPDHPDARQTVKRPIFIVGAVMMKTQFYEFRALCNLRGVWVNRPTFWPFDKGDNKFEYSISTVQMNTPWVTGVVLVGTVAGLMAAKHFGIA